VSANLPHAVLADLQRAKRLEWWTLAWMGSVVAIMWVVMGSSQAMKTAVVEDVLSLVPALVFLVATRFEQKQPDREFPFGFHRVHSLAALIAAVALTAVGLFLLYESILTLVMREHPTIAPVSLFGQDIWQGWLMILALIYSVVPPVLLGRLKEPIARRLHDKVLHTDAMMQKADWQTGLAGVGLGFWWADAIAAGLISLSIAFDGLTSLRLATAELVDGTPRALEHDEIASDAQALISALEQRYPGTRVRLRETGRYICAEIIGASGADAPDLQEVWAGAPEDSWRLVQLSFVPNVRDA